MALGLSFWIPFAVRRIQRRASLLCSNSTRLVSELGSASRPRRKGRPTCFLFQHAGGATDILVNQQQHPSAGWFRLGAFVMSPGQNHGVEVAGALEGVTVADLNSSSKCNRWLH